ncbi:hypothetical protein RF11_16063 [Thelohanellus kitauei]|uniref:Uncharacterized protein n=1 Tax=Thelohanellus kitauei TaxID=669202 RepID=A0A0C2MMT7_THEKT|nr:hypothetical protein RF11_16063 [Thelohanellus kitauei]
MFSRLSWITSPDIPPLLKMLGKLFFTTSMFSGGIFIVLELLLSFVASFYSSSSSSSLAVSLCKILQRIHGPISFHRGDFTSSFKVEEGIFQIFILANLSLVGSGFTKVTWTNFSRSILFIKMTSLSTTVILVSLESSSFHWNSEFTADTKCEYLISNTNTSTYKFGLYSQAAAA